MRQRILLLDFLRIFSVLIIAPYYLNDFSLYAPLKGSAFAFVNFILYAIKFFAFSGFVLVFLVFFIMGLKKNTKNLSFTWSYLFLGFCSLSLFAGYSFFQWSFHWDTYHFVALSFVILLIINFFSVSPKKQVIFGALLLCIPFWNFSIFYSNSILQEAIIGVCGSGISRGTWPLLPWLGLVFFANGLGALYRINQKALSQISRHQFIFWIALTTGCLFFWGAYSKMSYGPEANCFIHRQSPWIFWVHFIVFLFFVRLAFLQKVQCFLQNYRCPAVIAKLSWSTHFGFSFIVFLLINALFGEYFYFLLEKDNLYLLLFSWSAVVLTHFIVKISLLLKKNCFMRE